jgi:dienelactone hydrolase
VKKFAKSLNPNFLIFDPYQGIEFDFEDEKAAYQYFTNEVGLAVYTSALSEYVKQLHDPVVLIGFSIGSSAVWQIAADSCIPNVVGAVCYYGSQIRNFTNLNPDGPVELIFPKRESHFSVDTLISNLKPKQNVFVRQVQYLHGFMNPLSDNFDQQGYNRELEMLVSRIKT